MSAVPEARFLNLEYIFAHFFSWIKLLMETFLVLADWISRLTLFSLVLSAIFAAGIIFLIIKIIYLKRKRIVHLADFIVREEVPEARTNKWDEIKNKIDSDNPSDWKMAILEADSLIDEIVKNIGYKGEDLGERLRAIEPSDFENLQNVWEAHKIRNKIAHEGDAFILTKDIAKETIEKYKKALRELKYI